MSQRGADNADAAAERGHRVHRFADLEVDTALQRVSRDGHEVPLPRLSYDLLLALVDAAPAVLSNEALMARVWPGLVVGERTVSQRVKLLRDALGDDPHAPRYVLGLRGRGYRLAVEVDTRARAPEPTAAGPTVAEPANAAPPTTAPQRAPEHHGAPEPAVPAAHAHAAARAAARPRRWIAAGAGLCALLALGVLAFVTPGGRAPAQSPRATYHPAPNSVAVLPFAWLGARPEDAYLARGVSETVLDQLQGIAALQVVSQVSTDAAAGARPTTASSRDMAARLDARWVVEGSVQVQGNEAVALVRLLDVASGRLEWSGRFVRTRTQMFALQDEAAARLAGVLQARLERTARTAGRPPPTRNTDAFLEFLQGRAQLATWSVAGADRAVAAFERAIALDPGFAAAYAELYDARLMATARRHHGMHQGFLVPSRPVLAARVREAGLLRKALALDPNCADAYYARAIWADANDPARPRDFARAYALDPDNGRGITAYAEILDRADRRAEALALLRRAVAIDPLAPRAHFWLVQRDSRSGATPAQMLRAMQGVLQVAPDYSPALQVFGKYHWMYFGDMARAVEVLEYARARDPENAGALHLLTAIYLDLDDVGRARSTAYGAGGPARASAPGGPGELLLAQYEGDVQHAGKLALAPEAFAFSAFEAYGAWEAVRDLSRARHSEDAGIAALRQRTGLASAGAPVTVQNFRAVPALADLLYASGQRAEADALVHRTLRWIDEVHLGTLNPVYALRVKATLLLMSGRRAEALAALRQAFAGAHDYQQWWYTLRLDPTWRPLHGDPAFRRIVANVQAHVAAERTRLADDRRAGAARLHAISR